jgi:hypothetical protein
LTTSRSGETFSGGAFGEAGSSFVSACLVSVFVSEHAAKKAAAELSIAAREKVRRLTAAGASFLVSEGEQVPHPEELQEPHPVAAVLITWSESDIDYFPFHRLGSRIRYNDSSNLTEVLFLRGQRALNAQLGPINWPRATYRLGDGPM